MLSGFTGIEELSIDREESRAIAEAALEVQSHYNMVADPKIVAWIGLAMALGSVYGPRVGAYKLRKKMERATKTGGEVRQQAAQPAAMSSGLSVVQMTSGGFPLTDLPATNV